MKSNVLYIKEEEIRNIVNGDEKATMLLLEIYDNYIKHFCRKTFYDINGNSHTYIDEDMSQFIKMNIIKYVKNFKIQH